MEIYRDLQSVRREENAILTVGSFDGVHLGHQYILKELRKQAEALGAASTLVTFSPHPKLVLNVSPNNELKILTTVEEKLEILQQLQIERAVIITFTQEFSHTPSDEFVRKVLFETIGFKRIIIGYDHTFGRHREGGLQTLKILARELHFDVEEFPELRTEDYVLNSTTIREFLREGDVKKAAKALGRNYRISGIVTRGSGRGQVLEYPTANILLDSKKKLVPGNGVYAVYVYCGQRKLKGMMNIGIRPTFNESEVSLEVHIFDFEQDIYNHQLQIEFVERIRNEVRFSCPSDLIRQLHEDRKLSIEILNNSQEAKCH
ncbi:MAG: bifunctional riboflavin kinase/FAD synthetase [bacterium]